EYTAPSPIYTLSLHDALPIFVKSMSEEHGILDLSKSRRELKVGDRVRIVPNHVCIVVHLADLVYGVRDDAVVTSWPVAARGRGRSEEHTSELQSQSNLVCRLL